MDLVFQWYPSGLVGGQELKGNTLPNVDVYHIPFRDTVPAFAKKAFMVYMKFDCSRCFAELYVSLYAKAFRGAGFQWATQLHTTPWRWLMPILNIKRII